MADNDFSGIRNTFNFWPREYEYIKKTGIWIHFSNFHGIQGIVWNPFMAMNTNTFYFWLRNTNTLTPWEKSIGPEFEESLDKFKKCLHFFFVFAVSFPIILSVIQMGNLLEIFNNFANVFRIFPDFLKNSKILCRKLWNFFYSFWGVKRNLLINLAFKKLVLPNNISVLGGGMENYAYSPSII